MPPWLSVVVIEKGDFGSPSTKVTNFTLLSISKYGANISPRKTPTTMSKKSVSPLGEQTMAKDKLGITKNYSGYYCYSC